jgi:hypothetical protein
LKQLSQLKEKSLVQHVVAQEKTKTVILAAVVEVLEKTPKVFYIVNNTIMQTTPKKYRIVYYNGGPWKCCKCGAQVHHSGTCWDPACNHTRCSQCHSYGFK